jgi:hypothetical protein
MNRPDAGLPAHVTAELPYLASWVGKPHYYFRKDPPAGLPRENAEFRPQAVQVWSARDLPVAPALDVEGFAVCTHRSVMRDFGDLAALKATYYPETAALVQAVTGADHVLVFDHNLRSGSTERQQALGIDPPARRAHNDYTLKSGPQRFLDLFGRTPAAGERYAMINAWRPLRGPVKDAPLAVCDARSLESSDFLATDLIYETRTGEIYSIAYRAQHRWYYVPDMQVDEVLFLKCFDSAGDGRARFTAHTAFDDPTVSPGVPPRESIEIRTVVRWNVPA